MPNDPKERMQFWLNIGKIIVKNKLYQEKVIMVGDFNFVEKISDKKGEPLRELED